MRPSKTTLRSGIEDLFLAPLNVLQRSDLPFFRKFLFGESAYEKPQSQLFLVNRDKGQLTGGLQQRFEEIGFNSQALRVFWSEVIELIDPA